MEVIKYMKRIEVTSFGGRKLTTTEYRTLRITAAEVKKAVSRMLAKNNTAMRLVIEDDRGGNGDFVVTIERQKS